MELLEAIGTRRSVRMYRPDPISRDLLEELLQAACWAPSADNAQPWYLVALTDPEELAALRADMEQVAGEVRPHLERMFPGYPQVVRDTTRFLRCLGNAPALVLIFLQHPDYPVNRDGMVESCAAAVQNLLLTAHARGLGACWVNAAAGTACGRELQRRYAPGRGEFLSMVTLGWPEKTPSPPARKPGRWVIR